VSRGRPPQRTVLIGEKIGDLEIVDIIGANGGRVMVRCACGRHVLRWVFRLRRETEVAFCSRQCPKFEEWLRRGSAPTSIARAIASKIRNTVKRDARHRRAGAIEFDLTVDDVLAIRVGRPCGYCGDPIPAKTPGIDRMDSSRGYTRDNVIACCALCNDAKGNHLSADEFRAAINLRLARLDFGEGPWDGYEFRKALHRGRN
jgi:5-methylcytosine-specific restriction endonuclease McrA